MGPLAFLGLLDRTGITDRAGLSIPPELKNLASLATNPQAFLTNQAKTAAAEANPQIAAGIAALDAPKAFTDDLKRSTVNGLIADSPLENFVPQQDYRTPDLIRTMQSGFTPTLPTYDNIDVGGGWNPSDLQMPQIDLNAFAPQSNYSNDFNYQFPEFDIQEWYKKGGMV